MAKAPTKAQLKRDLEQARLNSEIAQHKLQRHLSESLYAPAFGDVINPWEQFYDGANLISPVGRWDSRLNSFFFLTEAQLDIIRWTSRYLSYYNLTAKGVIRSLENYVIKTGYEYVVTGKGKSDDKSGKVKKVQQFVDDFLTKNNWFERELDWFKRTRRDGEALVRLFAQDDGIPLVRTIEPELVRAPDGTKEWMYGVLVDSDDVETVRGYNVCYNGNAQDGELVAESEVVHQKVNSDLIVRRGISDFLCSYEALVGVQKLLKAAVMGESVRQAISLIRQHAQANKQTVLSLQSTNTDWQQPVPSGTSTRLQPVQQIQPGSVLDIPESLEFKDGPQGNGANAQVILQQAYQALSAYWQVPTWMVSGDSGNVNFASSLTMESPFVRNCEKEQKLYSNKFCEIIWKAIDIAMAQGILPEDTREEVDVTAHCPPLVVRNAKEETDRNEKLAQNGLLSKRTWSDREELDYDQQQEQNKLDGDVLNVPTKTEQRSVTPDAQYARETNRPE